MANAINMDYNVETAKNTYIYTFSLYRATGCGFYLVTWTTWATTIEMEVFSWKINPQKS